MNTTTKTGQSIYPALRYDEAKAAIAWLTSALGFEEHQVYEGANGRVEHAELKIAGNFIMLGSDRDGVTSTTYIALDSPADVDATYRQAKAAGAQIVREPCDTDYGSHEFGVRDPEGHGWSFGTYRPHAQ